MGRRVPITKLRISFSCEVGLRYEDGQLVNHHRDCMGYANRTIGRRYRCQCACHKVKN